MDRDRRGWRDGEREAGRREEQIERGGEEEGGWEGGREQERVILGFDDLGSSLCFMKRPKTANIKLLFS